MWDLERMERFEGFCWKREIVEGSSGWMGGNCKREEFIVRWKEFNWRRWELMGIYQEDGIRSLE